MYIITVTIKNPLTNKAAQLVRQFDENTLDQAKWSSAFPAVQTELNNLKAASAAEEPIIW